MFVLIVMNVFSIASEVAMVHLVLLSKYRKLPNNYNMHACFNIILLCLRFRYVCISSVFSLTSQVSSLTVTLVLTLRKFVSLMFSIVYFSNEFTMMHWLGSVLVFGGTLIFTNVIVMPWDIERPSIKQHKKTD